MKEVHLIIRVLGDYNDVVDKAYTSFKAAYRRSVEIQKTEHAKGYTDFKWIVKSIELI